MMIGHRPGDAATLLVTGCEHTREGVERDAENAAVKSEQAAETVRRGRARSGP